MTLTLDVGLAALGLVILLGIVIGTVAGAIMASQADNAEDRRAREARKRIDALFDDAMTKVVR